MSNPGRIIIVDDEAGIRQSLTSCLRVDGYEVEPFGDVDSALSAMRARHYDLAIIDIRLGSESGLSLFQTMKREQLNIPAIFISGNASLNEAVQSVKAGAYDFIEKPFSADKLAITVRNCLEYHGLKARITQMESNAQNTVILGEHRLVQQLRRQIEKVAQSESAVFIAGESGTGKELIAHCIHEKSQRSGKPFIKVNCSAIPENLIESALFGHVRGAFTGADSNKKGFFEMADGGTLFLDEIGDMSLASQASLLRVLESSEIQKVGSGSITRVNVRVLAASHKELKNEIAGNRFREDLFYRLNVIPLHSPPLRERASDIPLLINHFAGILAKKNGLYQASFAAEIYPVLMAYAWPGNIRELLNTVERMVVLGSDRITLEDIPAEIIHGTTSLNQGIPPSSRNLTLKEYRNMLERQYIVKKLQEHAGNISRVAKALGIDRTHLHKKIAHYDIQKDSRFD